MRKKTGYRFYLHRACYTLEPINLGLSGSCHIEKEMADYISQLDGWDIATFELGVSMRAAFEVDEFERGKITVQYKDSAR